MEDSPADTPPQYKFHLLSKNHLLVLVEDGYACLILNHTPVPIGKSLSGEHPSPARLPSLLLAERQAGSSSTNACTTG